MRRERGRASSPLEALHTAMAAMVKDLTTPTRLANHLSLLELDLTDPEFRRLATRHARGFRREIALCIRDAVVKGELRDCDVEATARAVFIAYNGALVLCAFEPKARIDVFVREAVESTLERVSRSR